MIKKLESILVEAPDFPQYVAESLTIEMIDAIWNFYSAGLTAEQAKRLFELNTAPKEETK